MVYFVLALFLFCFALFEKVLCSMYAIVLLERRVTREDFLWLLVCVLIHELIKAQPWRLKQNCLQSCYNCTEIIGGPAHRIDWAARQRTEIARNPGSHYSESTKAFWSSALIWGQFDYVPCMLALRCLYETHWFSPSPRKELLGNSERWVCSILIRVSSQNLGQKVTIWIAFLWKNKGCPEPVQVYIGV